MKWEKFTIGEVKNVSAEWSKELASNSSIWLPPVDSKSLSVEYNEIRNILIKNYESLLASKPKKASEIDVRFSIVLYDTLNKYGFGLRQAGDHEMWLYINLQVIPDIVFQRFDRELNSDWLFGATKARIWTRALWWLVHLSLQDDDHDYKKTKAVLRDISDVSQVTDRAGKEGIRVELQRRILYYYSLLPKTVKGRVEKRGTLLSRLFQLSIVKCKVVEPALCAGGEDAFARGLFSYFGFDLKEQQT